MSGSNLEFNKMTAAILVAGLITIGIGKAGNALYTVGEQPEKRGYSIEVADASGGAGEAVVAAGPVQIAAYMAAGDIAKGKKATKACAACHSFDKGGKNKVGPALWNIVNAKKGAVAGFSYSKAMGAQAGQAWNFQALSEFLTKPKKYMPGTKMSFSGIKKAEKRANVLAYLRSLSDSPAALPAAK